MKQMQRVRGYGHPEAAHTSPISSIPQLEDKQPKHQSLIQRCLKSLIKERLSGRLVNAARKKRNQEENNSKKQTNKFASESFMGINKFLNDSIRNPRYQDPENLTPVSFVNDKHTRHQSTLASINERASKLSQYRNRLSIIQVNKSDAVQKLKKSALVESKRNVEVSFISAIDHNEEDSSHIKGMQSPLGNPNNESKVQSASIKLPEIKSKSNKYSMASLVSPTSIVKGLLKRTVDYNINQTLWKFLTGQSEGRQRLRKFSTSITDLNSPTALANPKQIKSSLFKPTVPSSSRQSFLKYLADLPPPFGRLLQFVISFFEIKIPQELSALFYSGMLDEIKLVNERAWSVIAFTFWDFNRDGIINSNDIFAVFREFNHFDSQNHKQIIINEQKSPVKEKEKPRKSIKHERNSNRQIISGTEEIINVLKQLKPKDESHTNQKLESKQGDRSEEISSKHIILNLENIQRALADFKSELSRLNFVLSSKQFETFKSEELRPANELPNLYLEQIVITQPILRYKQVLPLFSAGGGNNNSPQGEKLDIFPKSLNVKACSSYKQCFISTEHNEETRMGREKIEEYKQELKNMRQKRNKILQSKIKQNPKLCKQLNYVKVAESDMGRTIKEIILNLLGYLE